MSYCLQRCTGIQPSRRTRQEQKYVKDAMHPQLACASIPSTHVVDPVSHVSCEGAKVLSRSVNANEEVDVSQTLVVMGDCKRGSVVRSTGSVIVLGRLLGKVVAGSDGDVNAVVTAGDLQPSHLRIADVTTKPAYWLKSGCIYGEMAYITREAANRETPEPSSLPTELLSAAQRKFVAQGSNATRSSAPAVPSIRSTGASQHATTSSLSIKVVPLARPYLSFGPASSQILRDNFEAQLAESFKSAAFTGAYAVALGTALMVAPMTVFSVAFDAATVSKGFVRLGGGLLALFGAYYWGAALGSRKGQGVRGFYLSTVVGRLLLAGLCVGLFLSGEIGAGVLLLGAMNGIGALMMGRAMLQDGSL